MRAEAVVQMTTKAVLIQSMLTEFRISRASVIGKVGVGTMHVML